MRNQIILGVCFFLVQCGQKPTQDRVYEVCQEHVESNSLFASQAVRMGCSNEGAPMYNSPNCVFVTITCPVGVFRQLDFDLDGVMDDVDQCLYVRANGPFGRHPSRRGCPALDQDGDSVPDHLDICPSVAGGRNLDPSRRGCPLSSRGNDGSCNFVLSGTCVDRDTYFRGSQ